MVIFITFPNEREISILLLFYKRKTEAQRIWSYEGAHREQSAGTPARWYYLWEFKGTVKILRLLYLWFFFFQFSFAFNQQILIFVLIEITFSRVYQYLITMCHYFLKRSLSNKWVNIRKLTCFKVTPYIILSSIEKN